MKKRTPQQIVDETNELARRFYAIIGYQIRFGYRFDQATHPQERSMWDMAKEAQLMLTDTDPQDALDELEQ